MARRKSINDIYRQYTKIADLIISLDDTSPERKAQLQNRFKKVREVAARYIRNASKAKAVKSAAEGYADRYAAAQAEMEDAYKRQRYGSFYDENETRSQSELDANYQKAVSEREKVMAKGPGEVKVSQRQYMGLSNG